jgi:hypothetical protein
MKKALATAALATIVLVVPSTGALGAAYTLPKPKDSKIVVPTSVAGISIGMSESKALAAWDAGRGNCSSTGTPPGSHVDCDYGDYESASTGSARISFYKHKVASLYISSARVGTGDPNFKAGAALLKIKTKSGLGIGAKYADVKKEFPKGLLEGTPKDERFVYTIKGKGKASFAFTFWGKNQKAFIISFTDGVYHP